MIKEITKEDIGEQWQLIAEEDINIIPIHDLIIHTESEECICKPKIIVENDINIIVHNSADNREIFETIETNIKN